MSIRNQILAPITIVALVGLSATVWTAWSSIRIHSNALEEYEVTRENLELIGLIQNEITVLEDFAKQVLSFNEVYLPDDLHQRLSTFESQISATVSRLRQASASGEIREKINSFESLAKTWATDVSVAFGLHASSSIPVLGHIDEQGARLHLIMKDIQDVALEEASRYGDVSRSSLIFGITKVLSLVACLLGLASVFALSRGVALSRLMKALADEMEAIRNGKFDRRVEGQRRSDELGEIARGVFAFAQTLKQLSDAKGQIAYQAAHDDLTGLPNRAHFMERLKWLLDSDVHETRFAILHIDLDRFKDVNDTYGHAAGDEVLKAAALTMSAALGPREIAARIGGDEFVVIVSADSEEVVADAAQCIIDNVSRHLEHDGARLRVGASIGIAFSEADAEPERLLANADVALYIAKSEGRGKYCFYSEKTGQEMTARTELLRDLRDAMDNGQIYAHFQPQIDLATNGVVGAEALVRWRHPKRGLLGPGQFLGLAAENGLTDRLTEVVMMDAVCALSKWREMGIQVPKVGLNFTAKQLRNKELISELKRALATHDLSATDIAIEILESVLFEGESQEEMTQISTMRRDGFHIELDDFGTGHASINNLGKFCVDLIKIDRDFVSGVVEDPTKKRLLKAMIDLCANLEIECLAEGVETDAEMSLLVTMGCRYAQGFGIARPMAFDEFCEWAIKHQNVAKSDVQSRVWTSAAGVSQPSRFAQKS